jgi:hypothetical protein
MSRDDALLLDMLLSARKAIRFTEDRDHAGDMVNLISLRESGQWKAYWTRGAAA